MKKWNKVVIVIFIALVTLVLIAKGLVYFAFKDSECSRTEQKRQNIDQETSIVIYSNNCGATTDILTTIDIEGTNFVLELAALDGPYEDISVELDDKFINIHTKKPYEGNVVRQQEYYLERKVNIAE